MLLNIWGMNANKGRREQWTQNEHTHTFISWFKNHILKELSNPNNTVSETLRWLPNKPKVHVFRYSSYTINRYKFYTRMKDMWITIQNCRVNLVVQASQVSSTKYKNHVYADMPYYEIVNDIWKVDYT